MIHNKDNKPQEKFVKLTNEWEQSVIFGGFWSCVPLCGSRSSIWVYGGLYCSTRTSIRSISNGIVK